MILVLFSFRHYVQMVYFLFCRYSNAFTSVHGERPSSEYAKIRKESLETQFGRILGSSSRRLFADRGFGPFLALYRAATISFHVVKLTIWHLLLNDMRKRAEKFRETLIRLGPFYIKVCRIVP
jgi:aarF domain-containing kinase